MFRPKDLFGWWSNRHFDRSGGLESATPTAWLPQSKPIRFTELGCPAIDRGTNQPNVFYDPKSSESFVPYFSRGWRGDAIQRAYLEASYLFWGKASNNPVATEYAGRMVEVGECAAWTWDARPYPFFPAQGDVWTDGANWRLGHWLTGRLGAVSLAALVRHLCLRAGLPETRIDVSGLWGAAEGCAITALESPRASITTLARHFGFDAVESEGVIRFVMRGRAPVATIAHDDLVAGSTDGEAFELTRTQETELPQALKWQVARADEDYDAALVEATRITVDTNRIASESFPMAVPPEEAERRCRRALQEAWAGRKSAVFRLPPSRLSLWRIAALQDQCQQQRPDARAAAAERVHRDPGFVRRDFRGAYLVSDRPLAPNHGFTGCGRHGRAAGQLSRVRRVFRSRPHHILGSEDRMTPKRLDDMLQMSESEFEELLARAAQEGARRALVDAGLDSREAALDIRDLRALLEGIRLMRRTAAQTVIRMLTAGVILTLLTGTALKLKLFGEGG